VNSTLAINEAPIHEVRLLGSTAAIGNGARAAVVNALK